MLFRGTITDQVSGARGEIRVGLPSISSGSIVTGTFKLGQRGSGVKGGFHGPVIAPDGSFTAKGVMSALGWTGPRSTKPTGEFVLVGVKTGDDVVGKITGTYGGLPIEWPFSADTGDVGVIEQVGSVVADATKKPRRALRRLGKPVHYALMLGGALLLAKKYM